MSILEKCIIQHLSVFLLVLSVMVLANKSIANTCISAVDFINSGLEEFPSIPPCSYTDEVFFIGIFGRSNVASSRNIEDVPNYYSLSKIYVGDKVNSDQTTDQHGNIGVLTLALGYLWEIDSKKKLLYNAYIFQQIGLFNERNLNDLALLGIDPRIGVANAIFIPLEKLGLNNMLELECAIRVDIVGIDLSISQNSRIFDRCIQGAL